MIDFDFHIHSAPYSGCATQPVKEAVEKAYCSHITTIALCDHNSIGGLKEARYECERRGITFVNGVELSALVNGVSASIDGNVIHILGYRIAEDEALFTSLKKRFDSEYQQQIAEKTEYLRELGYKIRGETTNERELRMQLWQGGYFDDEKAAKAFLQSNEMKKIFPPKKIPVCEAIDMIHDLGGLAVLAHPNTAENHVHLCKTDTNSIIDYLVAHGLDGLEAFHPSTVSEVGTVENLLVQAQRYGLKVTLGSDRHHCDDRYGQNYFSMEDKLQKYEYDFDSIKNFFID